jgi:hypothetical protein
MTHLDDASANQKDVDHATAAGNRIMSYALALPAPGGRCDAGGRGKSDDFNVRTMISTSRGQP